MTDGQLSFPERVELSELTAAELYALTPEECFAILPDYSAEELDKLRSSYFNEWMSLSDYLIDRGSNLTEEQLEAKQAWLAELCRRKTVISDFVWWKRPGATFADIEATFEYRRESAEAERRYDEKWKARDAADLAAGKPYAVWRKLMADKKNRSVIFCQ